MVAAPPSFDEPAGAAVAKGLVLAPEAAPAPAPAAGAAISAASGPAAGAGAAARAWIWTPAGLRRTNCGASRRARELATVAEAAAAFAAATVCAACIPAIAAALKLPLGIQFLLKRELNGIACDFSTRII